MARVTRSSKLKATPLSTPTKSPAATAKADPDTPIASVEIPAPKKDTKGPYARKPRKKRTRDAIYKKKTRAQALEVRSKKLGKLKLDPAERDALRAGVHGHIASKKMSDALLEQRAEIARLRKQLNDSSKEAPATSPANGSTPAAKRRQEAWIPF